jgi:tetratricopeptide (TPR) repeat protein
MSQQNARGVALGLFGLLTVFLAGCRGKSVEACIDLVHAGRYEAALARCGEVYAARHDPRAGAAIVESCFSLGREDAVLSWVDRLAREKRGYPGEWSLAAAVHEQRGEAAAAEQGYRRDLELFRAAGNHARAADSLQRLSHLAWEQSRYRDAVLSAGEAVGEAEAARDRTLAASSAEALYTALYAVGDLEGARLALERAGSPDGTGSTERARFLANRGNVLLDEGRLALARHDLEAALALAAGSDERQLLRSAHLNLTRIHLDLGEVDRAAQHLAAAWQSAEPGQPAAVSLLDYRARVELARGRAAEAVKTAADALATAPAPDWAWDLELLRGRAEEARGDGQAAAAAYERSIAIVEEMRRSLAFDELKSWLLDRKREPFEALFRLQARAGRDAEALATAERAQSRTFLDAFVEAASAGHPPVVWSPQRAAERMRTLEALLPAMSASPVAAVQPIGRVLSAFGDRHGLVFFEAEDTLWLITVAGGKPRLRPLSAGAAEVRRLVESFLAHLDSPEGAGTGERLAEILLPADALPPSGRTLYIVADGMLGNLPFAALRRHGRYLVEDHSIVFLPSLNALAAIEGRSGPAAGGPPLALSDAQGNLPAAAAEAEVVAKLIGGGARTAGRATAAALREAAQARVLHLATHTGVGPRGPWLQLADRRVTAADVISGRIGPRLAVLATCSSGVRPGRQMWGSMGAAFLAAGSRTVVSSLGSVEDGAARDFVLGFYRAGGAADPAGALARTQRVAIARGLSPTHWAPFVLFGSGEF